MHEFSRYKDDCILLFLTKIKYTINMFKDVPQGYRDILKADIELIELYNNLKFELHRTNGF